MRDPESLRPVGHTQFRSRAPLGPTVARSSMISPRPMDEVVSLPSVVEASASGPRDELAKLVHRASPVLAREALNDFAVRPVRAKRSKSKP